MSSSKVYDKARNHFARKISMHWSARAEPVFYDTCFPRRPVQLPRRLLGFLTDPGDSMHTGTELAYMAFRSRLRTPIH